MNILSIQSHVAYGHVGNAAAVFVLQRLGAQVWPLHTVQFSNHKGYGAWTGQEFNAGHIAELVEGLAARGVLVGCDAVLSGYIGQAEVGAAIEDAVRLVRRANPDALYLCDPVMGDDGGFYTGAGIPAFFRERALPLADIVTPNRFELAQLSGREIANLDGALAAARDLLALGPRLVLITGFRSAGAQHIDLLAVTPARTWRLRTPYLHFEPMPNGTGDTLAALFLAKYLELGDTPAALAQAGAALHAVLRATQNAGTRELALIAAQNDMVNPALTFEVEALN